MIKIGLTGSIGMGKTTVALMLEEFGAARWSADDAVHRLYEKGGDAVAPIEAAFPTAIVNGRVDREKLSALVLGDPDKLRRLEAIVHPLVSVDRERFGEDAANRGVRAVVFDIPLLFENNTEDMFDAVIVVSALETVQRARVLARPGMTEAKLDAILAEQTPDAEKRRRADYVIDTGQTLDETRDAARAVFDEIIQRFSI